MNNLVRRVFLISIFATAIMTTFGVFELARADGLTMKQQERAFESANRMLKDQAKVRISDKGFLARHERKQREKMQQAIFYTVVFFALLPALIFLVILILKPEHKQKNTKSCHGNGAFLCNAPRRHNFSCGPYLAVNGFIILSFELTSPVPLCAW